MRALVFEQWQGGHYFNYLECLVPRLASICDEVVVAITAAAASSPRFAEQLGHLEALPNVRFDREVRMPDARMRVRFRAQLGRNVVDAIDRHRPDCVFLPSADEQVLALPLHALAGQGGRVRRLHLEAVLHYKGYTARDGVAERLLSTLQGQLLKTGVFDCLNFVNFLQYEDAVERRLPWAAMARAAGDPGAAAAAPRARRRPAALGLDPGGRYIGMIGDLDARKAVPATLAAFRASGLAADDRLLLAGRLAEGYAQILRDDYQDLVRAGRVVVMDRFLTAGELQAAFCALDLHVSVYHRFAGLSSLMLKSLAAGVPVLANDHGWARAVVRRFEVGRTVDPADTTGFASALAVGLGGECETIGKALQPRGCSRFIRSRISPQGSSKGLPWQRAGRCGPRSCLGPG